MCSCLPQSKVVYCDYCFPLLYYYLFPWNFKLIIFFFHYLSFLYLKIVSSSWSRHMFYQEPVTVSVVSILVPTFSHVFLSFTVCTALDSRGNCTYFCDPSFHFYPSANLSSGHSDHHALTPQLAIIYFLWSTFATEQQKDLRLKVSPTQI